LILVEALILNRNDERRHEALPARDFQMVIPPLSAVSGVLKYRATSTTLANSLATKILVGCLWILVKLGLWSLACGAYGGEGRGYVEHPMMNEGDVYKVWLWDWKL